jgi:phospho-N-acetylmuramoyl-pentapeptide-transferase
VFSAAMSVWNRAAVRSVMVRISSPVSAALAFLIAIFLTPIAIRYLRDRNVGQFIQEEVPEGHLEKHGTPTMGGVVMILSVVAAYAVSHVSLWTRGAGFEFRVREFTMGGLLVVFALVGMGMIGFFDDLRKVTRERNLGLSKRWKFGGQLVVAGLLAWGAVSAGVPTTIGLIRPTNLDLGPFFLIWVLLMLTATANAVNITDGLDGLASGSSALVFGAYMIIAFWIFRHPDFYRLSPDIGSLELATLAAALLGATLAFLWWNTAPARIFMGDVGSQGLGGAMAALALLTNTHLLLVVLAGLFVVETMTVIMQVASFRLFGKRIFLMTPLHHHFELKKWPETTIIVRFWIFAAIGVAFGLGLFYGDSIVNGGIG